MSNSLKKYRFFPIYLLGFIFSLQVALPNYINSSYLSTVMPEIFIGFIYTAEAILAILGFLLMPRLLKKFGNFRLAVFFIFIEMISLFGLVASHNIITVSLFMVSNLLILTFLSFSFDIFLEGLSLDTNTGKTRGTYLTFSNLAWIFAPILTGLILTNGGYWKIYLSSFILLIPIFFIVKLSLRGFKDSNYQVSYPFRTLLQVWKNKDIKNIFMANFLLQVFYSWMTIYTPIYLHLNLGFSWGSIGFIFGIMLLPFIFVQFPAGRLADSRFGEKEMLSVGFIIMALATMIIFFIDSSSILIWGLILFGTRIGAAIVEIMCDVYFFKKVDNKNANLISFYRIARPLAYIIGPLLAMIVLSLPYFGIKSLFLVLGFIMFFGLRYSLTLKDTK